MTHIPQDKLDFLKQMLINKRAKLAQVREENAQESPALDDTRADDNSSDTDAREEVQLLHTEVVGGKVDEMLARIDAALDRIAKGTYGLTADGKEIPVERLLVDPTATSLVQ